MNESNGTAQLDFAQARPGEIDLASTMAKYEMYISDCLIADEPVDDAEFWKEYLNGLCSERNDRTA